MRQRRGPTASCCPYLGGLLLCFSLWLSACAGHAPGDEPEVIYIERDPPARRVETVPIRPAPAAIWIPGQWRWNGYRHVWLPGYWEVSPRGVGYPGIGPGRLGDGFGSMATGVSPLPWCRPASQSAHRPAPGPARPILS